MSQKNLESLQTVMVSVEKISEYEFNNRVHSPAQITHIAQSIERFGFNQPLVLDEDGIILVGHGRLAAAKSLAMKKVPCVIISGLDENEKKAYRILDNKIQNDSTWDFANLEAELSALKDSGFELTSFGLEDLMALSEDSIAALQPKEYDETAADSINKCSCPTCGNEHASKK